MSEESNIRSNHQNEEHVGTAASRRRRSGPIAIATIAIVLIVAIVGWLFWPKPAGKPVPAPRSVSFAESTAPQTVTTWDHVLTVAPEQLQRAGLKIETVG